MTTREKVLCFESRLVENVQGLSTEVTRWFPLVTHPDNLVAIQRDEAEKNPRFKQLIPFVLVFRGQKILRYQRVGTESRLHGLYSIGIGGHLTDQDASYQEGMLREVREETGLEPLAAKPVAVINDNSTEVGKVHFGIVHIMPNIPGTITGSELKHPQFIHPTKLGALSQYEHWSALCIQHLVKQGKYL